MARLGAFERAHERLLRLDRTDLDSEGFREAAASCLRTAISFCGWCWTIVDPLSLVPTWAATGDSPLHASQRRLFEIERAEPDAWTPARLLESGRGISVLSQATGGDLSRSARWVELLRPYGIGDELRAVLVAGGTCWGTLTLYRERRDGRFAPEETSWLATLLPRFARRLRRDLARPAPPPGDGADEPGMILIGRDGGPVAATAAAHRWLARLPGPAGPEPLPGLLYALVARLDAGLTARARLRTRDGCWAVAYAAHLHGAFDAAGTAVVIEPARSEEVRPLFLAAHGLTRREREVTEQVLAGRSGPQIAAALHLSLHTVQDHLKAVFDKTGVRSRRELMARVGAVAG
ncbi:MAG TPA: helix-turn-helix transcriptional regulator [Candidatus Dormibacteraeota bacterium]|nr:helix-turn-helix transcriptional regulator [Candidatus Dormibacteraeota bacterium]